MMRNVLLITLTIFLTGFVNGQSWEDSLRIGKQYYKEKQFDKSYRTLLEAQKLAPSHIDLSQDIGNAAYRSEDYDMAEKAFRSAASKQNDESQNAKNWHNVGNSQMKAKNYQEAVESYKQSLRKNPSDDKTRYNLAEAQRRLKVQEQQNEKQSQEQKDQNDDQQNQQAKSNQEDKDGQGEENKDQNQDPNDQGGNPNENAGSENESKLSDRKTERMLEDLLKQEMQTKKKVRGVESGKIEEQIKSGKRW